MGLYNALDDLLPGPGSGPEPDGLDWSPLNWSAPDPSEHDRGAPPPAPVPQPARPGNPRTRRTSNPDPFDDLPPGPPAPSARGSGAGARGTGAGARGTGAGAGGTAIFDALDDLLPGPPAPAARPARVRASFSLPPDVLDAVRDAAAHLASGPGRMTPADLAEQALRTEVDRLADQHNHGRPFPRRPGR